MKNFQKPSNSLIVHDRFQRPIVLFTEQWEKQYASKQNPQHQLLDIF